LRRTTPDCQWRKRSLFGRAFHRLWCYPSGCYNETRRDPQDHPHIVAPPPLIALGGLLVGFALDWLVPAYLLATVLGSWACGFLGGILLTSGAALGFAGRVGFIEAGT